MWGNILWVQYIGVACEYNMWVQYIGMGITVHTVCIGSSRIYPKTDMNHKDD